MSRLETWAVLLGRLLLALCLTGSLSAQAFQLDAARQRVDLAQAVYYLEDPAHALTLQDVGSPEFAAQFRRWDGARGNVNFGYSASAYWLRLCLARAADAPDDWLLELSYPLLNELEFAAPGRAPVRTGSAYPLASRELPDHYFVFRLRLDQQLRCHYLRVASQEALILPLLAWQPAAYELSQQRELLWHGLYHGGLLALLLYNLLLFLSLRDRRFLLYSLYDAALSLGIFASNGFSRIFLWSDWPGFDLQSQAIFLALAAVFSVWFAREFLQTRILFPRLDVWLRASALGFLATVLLLLVQLALDLDFRWLLQLHVLNGVLSGCVVTVAAVLVWRGGGRSARTFLLAWGALWLGVIVAALHVVCAVPSNFWTGYALQIGAGVEMLLMSLALAETIRQERDRALDFQRRALESSRQAHELNAQLAASRQLARDKSEFLARVSHELRTPLNAIVGYARMLRRGSDRITLEEGTVDIERSGMRLLGMIEELLDQSQLSAGRISLSPGPLALRSWLQEVGRTGSLMTEAAGNRFELQLSGELGQVVEADGHRLRQVLDNLLGNANRHTRNGRIVLSCAAQAAQRSDCLHLEFAVADSGDGIAQQDLERIFEPFFIGAGGRQPSNPRARRMGLGLSISRDLVGLMGGELSVDSRPGEGSRFHFGIDCRIVNDARVPARQELSQQPSAAMAGPVLPGLGRRQGELCVLLAAHDAAERQSIAAWLGALGCSASVVSGRQQLIDLLDQDRTRRWDVIVTDHCLSDGDGWAVLRHVRATLPVVPVVVLGEMALQRPAGFPAGLDFDACLSRPLELAALFDVLSRLLPPLHLPRSQQAAVRPEGHELDVVSGLVTQGAVSDIEDWAVELGVRRPDCLAYAQRLQDAARRQDLAELRSLVGR